MVQRLFVDVGCQVADPQRCPGVPRAAALIPPAQSVEQAALTTGIVVGPAAAHGHAGILAIDNIRIGGPAEHPSTRLVEVVSPRGQHGEQQRKDLFELLAQQHDVAGHAVDRHDDRAFTDPSILANLPVVPPQQSALADGRNAQPSVGVLACEAKDVTGCLLDKRQLHHLGAHVVSLLGPARRSPCSRARSRLLPSIQPALLGFVRGRVGKSCRDGGPRGRRGCDVR
mmetsp:Transcript_119744/g.382218  ORF Transcript_119744/g.382218 Transcript_119744/m.382218 type:complete len:227 (+) Transcript_119744:684-1364(+)